MNKPVRTTLVFGMLSALTMAPLVWWFSPHWGLPLVVKLALWADLSVYAVFMSRWSQTRITSIAFPMLLLLGIAAWPHTQNGFLLAAVCIFSWVRSGICFKTSAFRNAIAEIVTILGSVLLLAFWWPRSAFAWGAAVWLFFLIQSLYFFSIPKRNRSAEDETAADPFEQARQELERLLEGGTVE